MNFSAVKKAGANKKGGVKKKGAKKEPEPEPEHEPTPEEIEEQKKKEAEAAEEKKKQEAEAAARKEAAERALQEEQDRLENERYQAQVARERRAADLERKRAKAKADMIEAAFDGEEEDMLKILDDPGLKVRIDDTDSNDYTALSEAACAGHPSIVKELLSRGANPNTVGKHKRTPIWRAVYMNQIDCIAPLLEAGADPRKAASDGEDAVLLATSQARAEIVALFESWDPSKADAINAEFEAKVAEQQRVDELREQAQEFALTQSYSNELSVAVDNATVEAMIKKLEAESGGNIDLDQFIEGWKKENPIEEGVSGPKILEFEGLNEALKQAAAADRGVVLVDGTERCSRFLTYNANTIDAKGLFILDKINGRPEDEIKEEMRTCCTNLSDLRKL